MRPFIFILPKNRLNKKVIFVLLRWVNNVRTYFAEAILWYFLFLSQLITNKIPIRNAGPAICRDQNNIYHPDGLLGIVINKLTIYNIPAKIKTTPPTISCFQDIDRTANRINTGILCINNPTTICQKLNSGEITSNENNAKKHINIIDRILGVQYINLFIFFPIGSFVFTYLLC